MSLKDALQIPRGLTSIIGGGGKSTLLLRLGQELAKEARVALCTSTRMLAPPGVPLVSELGEAKRVLEEEQLICFGAPAEEGKLGQGASAGALISLCEYVICEADGSKRLPLKAHAPYEPVILPETKRLIYVVGLDGIGQSIAQAAHRPALYAQLLGEEEKHVVLPADVIRAVLAEGYGAAGAVLVLNKAEGDRLLRGQEAAALWPGRAVIASLADSVEPVKEIWEHGSKQS